jgi:two-component system, sensor histidine kinase RegB
MAEALAAAQLALSREQRLTAIGALAAAAAHELGTPLATIKLISGELARDLRDHPTTPRTWRCCASRPTGAARSCATCRMGRARTATCAMRRSSPSSKRPRAPTSDRGKRLVYRINGQSPEVVGERSPWWCGGPRSSTACAT